MYDYQTISTLGSGRLSIDVLAEQCLFEGAPIPPLNISGILGRWLLNDLTANNIPAAKLYSVTLEADLKFGSVTEKERKTAAVWAGGIRSKYVTCEIHCQSAIVTDEKKYTSSYNDYEEWPSDLRVN